MARRGRRGGGPVGEVGGAEKAAQLRERSESCEPRLPLTLGMAPPWMQSVGAKAATNAGAASLPRWGWRVGRAERRPRPSLASSPGADATPAWHRYLMGASVPWGALREEMGDAADLLLADEVRSWSMTRGDDSNRAERSLTLALPALAAPPPVHGGGSASQLHPLPPRVRPRRPPLRATPLPRHPLAPCSHARPPPPPRHSTGPPATLGRRRNGRRRQRQRRARVEGHGHATLPRRALGRLRRHSAHRQSPGGACGRWRGACVVSLSPLSALPGPFRSSPRGWRSRVRLRSWKSRAGQGQASPCRPSPSGAWAMRRGRKRPCDGTPGDARSSGSAHSSPASCAAHGPCPPCFCRRAHGMPRRLCGAWSRRPLCLACATHLRQPPHAPFRTFITATVACPPWQTSSPLSRMCR